jgi:ABC-2 type transport system ATP-binding protein
LEEAESLCRTVAIIDHGRIEAVADTATLLSALDAETFVLNLRSPATTLPALDGFVLELVDDSTLEVQISREYSINALFEALSAHGIEVLSMRNKQNRLEKLFLDMLDKRREQAA